MAEGYSAEEEALVSLVLKWIDRPGSIVTDQLYGTFRHLFNACNVDSLSDDVEIQLQALAEKIKKQDPSQEKKSSPWHTLLGRQKKVCGELSKHRPLSQNALFIILEIFVKLMHDDKTFNDRRWPPTSQNPKVARFMLESARLAYLFMVVSIFHNKPLHSNSTLVNTPFWDLVWHPTVVSINLTQLLFHVFFYQSSFNNVRLGALALRLLVEEFVTKWTRAFSTSSVMKLS